MNIQNTTLEVQGMSCGGCVRHVTDALALAGVEHVDVRLRDGLVIVRHDVARTAIEHLVAALGKGGFPARLR